MAVCGSCGFVNVDGVRFCGGCGQSLEEPRADASRERKVVSVLFCDLVGFTAASDGADPEDVQAALTPYHARLRSEIERFGGTVEKFIGDAVMAVFGAPLAHEDDPERAVRAGLRLLEAVEELSADLGLRLTVRIGVATGRAVVTTSSRPELGEGMVAGDVVNTAARLQTSAAPGTVVVGEGTWRATHRVIDYKELDPVEVKGKADPLPWWQALHARSRVGESVAAVDTALVGRHDELEILKRTFSRCVREDSVHLVTIVAEPGMGKSRLVQELFEWVDARPELITWRQGRCLPYGGGTPLGAVGQIVKAQAGILDTDDREATSARLREAITFLTEAHPQVPGQDSATSRAAWMASQLGPVVGLPGGEAGREELFAAAQGFLEAVAGGGPLVLVVEDLHWAERPMLELLEHLLEWVEGVPMLLLATARPELYDVVPNWGGGRRNATTLGLAPLTDVETAELVAGLAGHAGLSAVTQRALLERAAGNPLYAEEFVRMLVDTRRTGDATAADEVPDTVQSVIAARLDTLSAPAKSALHDAAVIGLTFWPGAVATVGGVRVGEVTATLHDLARRDYLRPSRRSVLAGEAEHTFAHALIRDVAYEQIPRADRAAKHVATARWLAAAVADNPGDYAAVIAEHYDQARDLTTSSQRTRDPDGLSELAAEAGRWHAVAAHVVQPIDPVAALGHYTLAIEVLAEEDDALPDLLAARAQALFSADQRSEAIQAFREAEETYTRRGLVAQAAATAARRATAMDWMDRNAEAVSVLDASIEVLQNCEAGAELVEAMALRAQMVGERHAEAVEWGDKAIALAEQLDASPLRDRGLVIALGARGNARADSGDPSGREDLRRALALALEHNFTDEALFIYNLVAGIHLNYSAPDAVEHYDQAILLARARGRHSMEHGLLTMNKAFTLSVLGRLDEALELSLTCVERLESDGEPQALLICRARTVAAALLTDLGRFAEAEDILEQLDPTIALADPLLAMDYLRAEYFCAQVLADEPRMAQSVERLAEVLDPSLDEFLCLGLLELAVVLIPGGRGDVVERILAAASRATPLGANNATSAEAMLAEAAGDLWAAAHLYLEAARGWQEYHFPLAEGHALLGAARCRLRLGEAAGDLVDLAREIFTRISALPLLRQSEELLA
jgi:class 3 adenylate cyclase/tetratricopeptide (TPR) repeat protein